MVDDAPGAVGGSFGASTRGDLRMLMTNDEDSGMNNVDSLKRKKKSFSAQRAMAERTLQSRFKPLDLTKEMAETYYYSREDIVEHDDQSVNLFWLDLAQWDNSKGGSFLSQVSYRPLGILTTS